MKKKEWDNIVTPKLLLKAGKVEVETSQKGPKVKKKSNTASTVASMVKAFKAPKPTKKRALTRSDFLSKTTRQGKSEWEAIKNTVIGNRGTTKMPVTKWIDVPEGMEVTEGGKLEKAEGFIGGRQKVTTMEETGITRWKDAYTGETITNRDNIHLDHTVSIDRARRSGKFKKLKDAQGFGTFLKNLVITKKSTNVNKGAKDLGQFEPTYEPKKYAKRYGEVMSDLGLVMTHGEGRAYKRLTGEEPKSQVQHILDMQRGEPIAETQTRHDMWMMKGKNRNK